MTVPTPFQASGPLADSSEAPALARWTPPVYAASRWAERVGNILPLAIATLVASSLLWAPWTWPTAIALAVATVAFNVYWLLQTCGIAAGCVLGMARIARWERVDWKARYAGRRRWRRHAEDWDWPRHLVIIPNYREPEAILERAVASLGAQANARQLVLVLAMEAREHGAVEKAANLLARYRHHFHDAFATFHPAGIVGETPGKGSNEAWAAREAYERLVVRAGDDIDRYTITSCDADSDFHPRHFEALNYLFLTSASRARTFWQPVILNRNNIWEIPAPLRIPDGLSSVIRVAKLSLPWSTRIPTSCYSLSWSMLHDVDYWDEEVIPEDWHLYLKCRFALGSEVHVEPVMLPLGNDCVDAGGYTKTLKAHYAQTVRHAWGASDVGYAWRAAFNRSSALGWLRGAKQALDLTRVHVLWASQWFLVTLGVAIPLKFATSLAAPMPGWWTEARYHLPGPFWSFARFTDVESWLEFDGSGLINPAIALNLAALLLALCLVPFIAIIALEWRLRGPRPAHVSRRRAAAQLLAWPFLAVITFTWSALPALHAQWLLASGRSLVYRVAEKGGGAAASEPAPVPVSLD